MQERSPQDALQQWKWRRERLTVSRFREEQVAQALERIASGKQPLPDAIANFQALYDTDPRVDVHLLRLMNEGPPELIRYVLRILVAVSDGNRITTGLLQHLNSPDIRIRTAAARLVCSSPRNSALVTQLLRDDDPRLRAEVVEAMAHWNHDVVVLMPALNDPHHRVACNAILSLFGIDEVLARKMLEQKLADERWQFRAAATWVIGAAGRPELYPLAVRMRSDPNPSVKWNALRAMSSLRRLNSEQAEAEPDPGEHQPANA